MTGLGFLVVAFGGMCWLLSFSGRITGNPPPRPERMVGGGPGPEAFEESARQYKRLRVVGTVALLLGAVLALAG